MTQKNNILNELKELNSSLASQAIENVYVVPDGYFENLSKIILQKIRASEAADAREELQMVSPLLAGISNKTPYFVPATYFDGLAERIMNMIRQHEDYQTSEEETASLSPLLGNLKKEMPYSIPEGYFDTLSAPVNKNQAEATEPVRVAEKARVISFTSRKWFRYAAAAVVTGLIVFSGIRLLNNNSANGSDKAIAKIEKKISNDIKNQDITSKDVDDFLDLTEAIAAVDTKPAANTDIQKQSKDYLKDIPDDEIVNFLDQLPEDTNDNSTLN